MKLRFLIVVVFCTFLSTSIFADLPVIDFSALVQMGLQLEKLKEQAAFIKQELQALSGNQYQWSNVQNVINNLGNIVEQSDGISYSAQNYNTQFKQYFPGYQPPSDFDKQYQQIANTTLNTIDGVMQAMGASANDFTNENARLTFLQQVSQSAQGQTQAIQAASQIASESVSQLQLLRQTVIAQTNAQTAYYAEQVQKEASEKAEQDTVVQAGSTEVPNYGTSGHYLNPPNF